MDSDTGIRGAARNPVIAALRMGKVRPAARYLCTEHVRTAFGVLRCLKWVAWYYSTRRLFHYRHGFLPLLRNAMHGW